MASIDKVLPWVVPGPNERPDNVTETQTFLEAGAVALKGSVLFRILAGLPGATKQCPTCRSYWHLEEEVCGSCGYKFVIPPPVGATIQ